MGKTNGSKVKTINISLTEKNLADLDKIQEERGCASRSETIRRLLDEAGRRGWLVDERGARWSPDKPPRSGGAVEDQDNDTSNG